LTRESTAEIDFLFENADPSAIGDQSCPVVERIGELVVARCSSVVVQGGGLASKTQKLVGSEQGWQIKA
jgi:hypothetical protein